MSPTKSPTPPAAELADADQPAPPAELADVVLADHQTLDKLTNAATVRMVYGTPVIQGDNIIIPAAEVFTAVGFGRGIGRDLTAAAEPGPHRGSGGGGWTVARPVAVVVISNGVVRVHPIFDMNKLLMTVVPVIGVIATLLFRPRRSNGGSD